MAQSQIHHVEKYLLTSAGGRATRFGGFPKHLLKVKRDKTRVLLEDVLRVRERTPLQVILAIKEDDATQSWIKEAKIDIVLKEPPFVRSNGHMFPAAIARIIYSHMNQCRKCKSAGWINKDCAEEILLIFMPCDHDKADEFINAELVLLNKTMEHPEKVIGLQASVQDHHDPTQMGIAECVLLEEGEYPLLEYVQFREKPDANMLEKVGADVVFGINTMIWSGTIFAWLNAFSGDEILDKLKQVIKEASLEGDDEDDVVRLSYKKSQPLGPLDFSHDLNSRFKEYYYITVDGSLWGDIGFLLDAVGDDKFQDTLLLGGVLEKERTKNTLVLSDAEGCDIYIVGTENTALYCHVGSGGRKKILLVGPSATADDLKKIVSELRK
jgi:hypothetical protein